MAHWLAETDAEKAAAAWYFNVTLIMLAGGLAVAAIVILALVRRWARRQHDAIDKDRAERRAARSTGRVDAWSAGAQRYVDHDKLPDDPPFDSGRDDMGEPAEADAIEADDTPPGYNDDENGYEDDDPRDPYGLFKDKPYEESDEDELGSEDDDNEFDDDFEDDEDDQR